MPLDRRGFLVSLAAWASAPGMAASTLPQLLPPAKHRRVVIVGGGWGGLSVARHLRVLAPALEIVLLERNTRFWSGPLSNKWLAGLVDSRYIVHDPAAAALTHGYRRIHANVTAVDRDRRRVVTAQGTLAYDWLVLAVGIRYDYRAWFGDDHQAADYTREHYPCAYIPGDELPALKRKLDGFAGGDLLMTLPPLPYRCPPSAYERAALIGWLLKTRRIRGRLIVLDPNPGSPATRRVFEERYREQILYVSDTQVKSVDPYKRRVVTEFDEYRFDDAILMAPQQAGDLLWQAGLIGRDGDGQPTGWADPEPFHLHAQTDARVFLVGDALGKVSPLFGHYPKSGHMANRQARIVAVEIAARAAGTEAPLQLPESVCHVFPDFDPPRTIRIESRYRVRGDGLIEQRTQQFPDPNPRDEDLAWAAGMFEEFLAFKR
jgi:NADPH-dependent 2,4-dienoyl-CoA reductase/sulfur reductase-like enzyme